MRFDMKHRDGIFRVAGVLALSLAAFMGSSGSPATAKVEEGSNLGAGPALARGMLIPARIRLIVRINPSRCA